MPSFTVADYHIGWICALSTEMTAALSMFDEEHPPLEEQELHDNNNYALGRIHKHNVVIACMPAGADGLVNAANVARDMARTFPALRVCLMVGIGGGIPNLAAGIDIRLGDVIISQPDGTCGGVVQYDKGKALTGEQFVLKGQLNQPPPVLLQTLSRLKAEHDRRDSWVSRYMKSAIEQNPKMARTGYVIPTGSDRLYCSKCNQDIEIANTDCMANHQVREQRSDTNPIMHYGVIASGNRVIKDAEVRDELAEQFGALCVEMEAAGLMNHFPCLVIRGVCDYADSHKNDKWHQYAAMTAAAYAKEFLYYASPTQTNREKPMQEVIGLLDEISQNSDAQLVVHTEHLRIVEKQYQQNQVRYETDTHAKCHQLFKTSQYEEFKDINPPRVTGTCQWVLSHPKYREWYERSTDDLLWISADPGCGKSVLARSLIENELRSSENHTICYFFFKDNQQQDSISTALCALIHQLFSRRRQLIRHAISPWKDVGNKLSSEISELWRVWITAARDPEAECVTCVLDALDECNEAERMRLISLLTDFYKEISSSPPAGYRSRLKILVTSRPYDDIYRGFNVIPSELPAIQLRGEDENDKISKEIDLVVQARVAKLATDLKLDSYTTNRLITKLRKMEHRTYLWLHLAIDDIYHTFRKSLRRTQQPINMIPSTVEQAYEKILNRVGKDEEAIVKQILQIVVGARRSLTVSEMAIALGVATSKNPGSLADVRIDNEDLGDRIRDLCGLFVFINHSKIYLIHQTAKEFLVSRAESQSSISTWKHCFHYNDIEEKMALVCVEFLCFKDARHAMDSLIKKFRRYEPIDIVIDEADEVESFAFYSAVYWHQHLKSSNVPIQGLLLSKILDEVYPSSPWFTIYWKASGTRWLYMINRPQLNDLQLAASLGHDQILKFVINRDSVAKVNRVDNNGMSALIWASNFGHIACVELLLDKGADVNVRDKFEENALFVASMNGHLEVVQLLMDGSADMSVKTDYGESPLFAASREGHLEVVRLLLAYGDDVNSQNQGARGALFVASKNGHSEIVKLLLAHSADVNAQDRDSRSALYAAASNGHLEVVKLLLIHGADVNAQDENGGTALYAALMNGHSEVAKLLMTHGADVNLQNKQGRHPLYIASLDGHLEVARLLLEHGVDVNAREKGGRSALYEASRDGRPEMVELLLAHHADVNAQTHSGRSALIAASIHNHPAVVSLLLTHGADMNAKSKDGMTALYAAAAERHLEVVELLLAHGVDVKAKGRWGDDALTAASALGNLEVVKLMVQKGGNELKDGQRGGLYGSALRASTFGGHLDVRNFLLDAGACYSEDEEDAILVKKLATASAGDPE